MILMKRVGLLPITQMLQIMVVFVLLFTCAVRAESQHKSCDEVISEIIDLHSDLVINEQFLAQSQMLGAYLEAAKSSDEPKRMEIYTKVLNILKKIKASSTSSIAMSEPNKVDGATPDKSLSKEKQASTAKYEVGTALLEIFKADSTQNLPDLPVIRTYWKNDLAYSGNFFLPERLQELGKGNEPYVARFSFYYKAERPGKYGFTVIAGRNTCKMVVSGSEITTAENEHVAQGVCLLDEGFYRMEFWLISKVPSYKSAHGNAGGFQVRVLTPNAFDAVPLTKNMMLMKEDEGALK